MDHQTTTVPTTAMIEDYEELITAHLSRRDSASRDVMLARLTGKGDCPECGKERDGDALEVSAFNHAMSQLLYRGRITMNEHREYELNEP